MLDLGVPGHGAKVQRARFFFNDGSAWNEVQINQVLGVGKA